MGEACTFVERDCVHEAGYHSHRLCSERAVAEVASAAPAGRSVILGRTGRKIAEVVRKGYMS